jgi:hypothetical protein
MSSAPSATSTCRVRNDDRLASPCRPKRLTDLPECFAMFRTTPYPAVALEKPFSTFPDHALALPHWLSIRKMKLAETGPTGRQ